MTHSEAILVFVAVVELCTSDYKSNRMYSVALYHSSLISKNMEASTYKLYKYNHIHLPCVIFISNTSM